MQAGLKTNPVFMLQILKSKYLLALQYHLNDNTGPNNMIPFVSQPMSCNHFHFLLYVVPYFGLVHTRQTYSIWIHGCYVLHTVIPISYKYILVAAETRTVLLI